MNLAALHSSLDYAQTVRPPIMVVGDTPDARARARTTAAATGLEILRDLTAAEALDMLDERVSLSALWIELDETLNLPERKLLQRADRETRRQQYGVVVATRLTHIDDVLSEIGDSGIDLVVDADEGERLATMALAAAPRDEQRRVHDVASDTSAARLRQLSEEVSRVAAALSRLSTVSSGPPLSPATMAPPRGDLPDVSAEGIRTMIRARRSRANHLPADLFADPAWDMLLDLLQAEIVQHRVPVSSLCIAAAVPATTALRWIKSMTDRGILVRRDDPHDGRRVFIEMAPPTSAAVRRYFQEVGMAGV